MDDCAIRAAAASLAVPNPRENQKEEAESILKDPDFLRLDQTAPELKFASETAFSFSSSKPCSWKNNNTVHGQFYRSGGDWAGKPCVLLVHGWNAELQYRYEFPFMARSFVRKGVNVAMVELPYHSHRRPNEPGAVRNFICDDIPVMLRATTQALSDIHGVLLWAKGQGASCVGVWGFSFGAWLAGLHVCQSDLPSGAILTTPVVEMDQVIRELEFCEPIRAALKGNPLDLHPLNLTSYEPRIPPNAILVTQSKYDQFVTNESIERLNHAWGRPEIWAVPQSHISVLVSYFVLRRTMAWMVRRLESKPSPLARNAG